jgi:hypothetical protein
MGYRCHKCNTPILIFRLGVCSACREPIPAEILPESKKQALLKSEAEEEARRDLNRKDAQNRRGFEIEMDVSDFWG